ncbi:hypothetical protein H6P81_020707 [Aristolochia fimbriata]|uniref:Geranylgeranyl transferase type II subunit beta n=1 Tax=Aristolochia fimbriata TaxID=158543 RepID=A0AAV7DV59_ARIFI|nr:hypothetical protein H6P81_020707 [Aristolochia fimbriata]
MADSDACLEDSHMLVKFSVVWVLLPSLVHSTMLIRTALGGGYVKGKLNLEILSGRPEKLPDVCYSWWVLSSLIMIDRVHWIDKDKLTKFILNCQDRENGGISDRPDDAVDVFHTYFGVAGLSLLEYPEVKPIDPAYALPVDVVNRIFFGK